MAEIAVIIPAYNHAHYLRQSIQSVLDQTFTDWELAVVDDGSTDDTPALMASLLDPRLRWVRQPNAGLSAARNTGLRETCAPLVTFLDADDWFLPNKLELLHGYLRDHGDVGLVAGGMCLADPDGRMVADVAAASPDLALPAMLYNNPIPVGGVLLRRQWLDRVGVFDEGMRACEDWDLWLRMLLAGCRFGWVERPVLVYRTHPNQMSRESDRMRIAALTTLDKFFKQPNVPESLRQIRDKVYSVTFINAAGRAYRAGEAAAARFDLEEAVRLYPAWAAEEREQLVDMLLSWADTLDTDGMVAYLTHVYDNLPACLAALRSRRHLEIGKVYLSRAFLALANGQREQARTHAMRGVLQDPRWLANRGVLSILLTSDRRTP